MMTVKIVPGYRTDHSELLLQLKVFEQERGKGYWNFNKVRNRANIRNRYNQAPHLTQETNAKVITSQLDITNESQEVSPFQAGDHKTSIDRRARKHNKNKTEIT